MAYRKLPSGVQDILPEECFLLNEIQNKLRRHFSVCGFDPVLPSSLEYYDTYSEIKNRIPQERMFKFTDSDGRLLVLRPDTTLAISRIAATKLGCARARLCYFADKWDMQNAGGLFSREIYQAGVECLGEEGVFSDAQAVAFAIECLRAVGVKNFILDIGHVGYFKGILKECGLNDTDAETVRRCINSKDAVHAEKLLRKRGVSGETLNRVLALPALFGGAEIFERAYALTDNCEARAAVDYLRKFNALLSDMGYAEELRFDLGTVKRLSYYSGIVFSALVKEVGAPVLSGGRYDNLAADFGKHIPAVGFAIGLKRIMIALERQGGFSAVSKVDVIICDEGAEGKAYRLFSELTGRGERVRLSASTGRAAIAAERVNAEKIYYVTKDGVETL